MAEKEAGLIVGWIIALFIAIGFAIGWLVWQGAKLIARIIKYMWQHLRASA